MHFAQDTTGRSYGALGPKQTRLAQFQQLFMTKQQACVDQMAGAKARLV